MEMNFEKTAIKVSRISIIGNAVLSLLKLFAGIFAHSGAMVSDAVHSASDVLSSIIVIVGVKIAARESDDNHQYGHERMESVAAILLAMVLCMTGLMIGYKAVGSLISGEYAHNQIPGILALVAAVISIVSKEAMYWYTRHYARLIDSSALMADAWHHRSDALSSIGSLVGIAGARMGFIWFDPVASIVICVFIVKAAYDIFKDAIDKMVDHAIDPEIQSEIVKLAKEQEGVLGISDIYTRVFGNKIYVDLDIIADGSQSLEESSIITERVHESIEKEFPKIKHIRVMAVPDTNREYK